MSKKVGIAGMGAMGRTVARALAEEIPGYTFHAASDITASMEFEIPFVNFATLAKECDLIVECLPSHAVPELMREAGDNNRDIICISSSALIIYPEILTRYKSSKGRIIVPSGAACGLDGVRALAQSGIKTASIASTKHPRGYSGAPYIVDNSIDLAAIAKKQLLFSGNAFDAAKAFPANINVGATLSLAGIGPEKTTVEIWADPDATGNTHEIKVVGNYSTITAKVENVPDPANPKTSMLAAYSIISVLKGLSEPLVVL